MPFTTIVDKDLRVKVPDQYVKALNLHEGDALTLDIVPLMGGKGFKQIEADLGFAQEYEVSMNTLHHYLPMWMRNFKANLPHFVKDAKSFVDIPPAEKKKCVVIANGPSLYETDLSPLKNFDGTVVSTNKPLKHLMENGVVPQWVAVLDAEDIVMQSFDHDIVRENISHMLGVLMPTTTHPKVVEFALKHMGKDKIFWSNPHFSDAIAPNVCETLTSITTIPSCEHGGNVGTFSYLMAIRPLYCDPIGLLGFDLSLRPSPKWTQEQTVHYRFFYIPRTNETYAMNPAFEYYIARLINLWSIASERQSTRTVNLTPHGPLNAVIGLQFKTLEEFCKD